MNNIEACPKCGFTDFGEGCLRGVDLVPKEKLVLIGSMVIAKVCTNCGFIESLRADQPSIFKKSK